VQFVRRVARLARLALSEPEVERLTRELGAILAVGASTAICEDTTKLIDMLPEVKPTILVGATGRAGTFTQEMIETMARHVERPIVMPLSNPTSKAECTAEQPIRWTNGRAIVATGSPFADVEYGGKRHVIGQANNVFVFPGVGLGAIVAEARSITDRMFLLAARELAAAVTPERVASGALYPPVSDLRSVSRRVAIAVATEAGGLEDPEAAVDGAIWWPDYVPYVRVVAGPEANGQRATQERVAEA